VGDLLKERGDLFVGFLGGFCQVPGVPLGLVGEPRGEFGVRAAALLQGRKLHDRRPDQRMAERQACGGLIGTHQTGPFGRSQTSWIAVGGQRPDEAQIAGAVQDGQQQQLVGRGGQRVDAGGEYRLQPVAERQRRGQGPGHGAGQVAEGDRELEQRERVAKRGVNQPPPHPRCHRGVAAGQQFGRRLIR
jgi:hypothetical protein